MKEKPRLEQFVTVRAAADSLGCTDQYIYQLVSSGTLRAIKMGTRAIRISVESLNEMIQSSWIQPSDEVVQESMKADAETRQKQIRPGSRRVARSMWMTQK